MAMKFSKFGTVCDRIRLIQNCFFVRTIRKTSQTRALTHAAWIGSGSLAFLNWSQGMIKLEQLQRGTVYRLQSRNLECGVWNGEDGFIGIRTKFGLRFLDMEIHWGLSKTFGTAQALETMGTIPESISLNISLGTECGNCHKPVNYVKRPAEQKGASGEWLHDDDDSPNCSVPFQNSKARKASPVVIPNDALFAELRKYDCDTQ